MDTPFVETRLVLAENHKSRHLKVRFEPLESDLGETLAI